MFYWEPKSCSAIPDRHGPHIRRSLRLLACDSTASESNWPAFIFSRPLFKSRLSAWIREIIPVGECQRLIRQCANRVFRWCWKCCAIPLRRLRSEGGTSGGEEGDEDGEWGGELVAAGGRYKMVVLLEQHGLIYHSPGVRRRSPGCEF